MINEKIIEIYQKKEKADEKITNLINDFLTKAHELVTLSNDFYQIEKTRHHYIIHIIFFVNNPFSVFSQKCLYKNASQKVPLESILQDVV